MFSLLTCIMMLGVGFLMTIYHMLLYMLVNIKLVWPYFYLTLFMLMGVVFSLLLGSLPFIYILGSSMVVLFSLSFITWSLSFTGSLLYMGRFHHNTAFVVILLFMFDSFVVLLRPVTLTLRVLINVSLGHYLIMMLHLNLYLFVIIVWVVELFVYLVQSYVFLTLTSSYTTML